MNLQLPTLWVASWSLLFGAGALAPLLGRSTSGEAARGRATNIAILCALLGSVAGVIGALAALIDPGLWSTTITLHSFLGSVWSRGYLPEVSLQIKVDPLSAVFALLIAAFAAIVAVYSFDALRAPYYRRQRTWIAGAFNVFIWATLLVVVVNDLFFLIVALEVMTLAFAGLTLYKHDFYQEPQPPGHEPGPEELKDARLAPQVYLGVSHVSTAFLLLAILLLVGKAKSFSYDDIPRLAPMTANLVFLLALAGLGIRAGLTPAHFWVPLVHPCSPTTTHAFFWSRRCGGATWSFSWACLQPS
ncbi:MAG: hypothetical protein IPK16_27460 [Anaerolineales bacterium]|nr:hypothetical protein [Anaerolineales bacterium]